MSIAWTTIVVILYIFPGILFYVGLYARDRIPREIVRVSVIGDVAVAVFVSLAIHVLFELIFRTQSTSLLDFLLPLARLDTINLVSSTNDLKGITLPLSGYVLTSGAIGLILGLFFGWTGLFATHQWARELRSSDVFVTVYIMTKTVVNDKVLMFRGGLTEFYLKSDGSVSYLVLNDAQKFHMTATDDRWTMADAHSLSNDTPQTGEKLWKFLAIDGANISNILFEKSPKLFITDAGAAALAKALEELESSLRKH